MADRYVLSGGKVNVLDGSGAVKRTLTLEALGQIDYGKYRKLTGQCETCGHTMDGHRQCGRCKILIGSGHIEAYINKGFCDHCIIDERNIKTREEQQ